MNIYYSDSCHCHCSLTHQRFIAFANFDQKRLITFNPVTTFSLILDSGKTDKAVK